MGFSQDNSQVVYFAGTSSSRYDMKRALSLGKCCKPKTIHTGGTTSTRYWYFFGVK